MLRIRRPGRRRRRAAPSRPWRPPRPRGRALAVGLGMARGPHAGVVESDGPHGTAHRRRLGDVRRQRDRHRVPQRGVDLDVRRATAISSVTSPGCSAASGFDGLDRLGLGPASATGATGTTVRGARTACSFFTITRHSTSQATSRPAGDGDVPPGVDVHREAARVTTTALASSSTASTLRRRLVARATAARWARRWAGVSSTGAGSEALLDRAGVRGRGLRDDHGGRRGTARLDDQAGALVVDRPRGARARASAARTGPPSGCGTASSWYLTATGMR